MNRPMTGAALLHLHRLFAEGTLAGMTDAQLLARFAADRDEAAFAALVERHGAMVLAVCRAVLGDEHAADDAFQATFLILARRSASLRPAGDSIGGYLHRVAHREARRMDSGAARRRHAERRAAAEAARRGETADPDLRAAVHRAVAGLPDRLRRPVVLCHLEGRTHAQAAAELRWGEATVRRRLANARDLLRSRLTRDGIAPAAGLLALLRPDRASAAEALLRSAQIARLAAGSSTGTGLVAAGAAWAARVAHVAAGGRLSFAAMASLGALCVIPGAPTPGEGGAIGGPPAAVPPVATRAATPPADPPPLPRDEPEAVDAGPAERVALSGRVERPDGSPAAGARVFAIEPNYQPIGPAPEPEVRARADAEGRFMIDVPGPGSAGDSEAGADRIPVTVVALADGFGPAIADAPQAGEALTLQLVPDDVPITGRVLDIDGQPLAGATVRVRELLWHPDGDLAPWLEELDREGTVYPAQHRILTSWSDREVEQLIGPATTGPDGRFRLEGVGRERVVELWIEGPTIETTYAYARTRPGETLRYRFSRHDIDGRKLVSYLGSDFELVAGPTQVVVGTVRDADTGRPLAGATVQSAGGMGNPLGYVQTTTDAEGRYRLAGLSIERDPLGNPNTVLARPPEGEPYPMMSRRVGQGERLAPVTIDFAMKRGVWVTGRVFDEATGEGLAASLEYFTFEDNPHLEDYPDLGYPFVDRPLQTEADGRFAVVGIPGRGIIAARKGNEDYRLGVGGEQFEALKDPELGNLPTRPFSCNPTNHNTLVALDIPEGAESIACDIPLDPGHRVEGRAVGPDGEARAGAWASGLSEHFRFWSRQAEDAEAFAITALGPDDRRLVLVAHEADRLAGMAVIEGGGPDEVAIEMQPWAEVIGRFVDADGRPFASAALAARDYVRDPAEGLGVGSVPEELITLESDGRFRIRGLLPGLSYTFKLVTSQRIVAEPITGLTVEAGEVKDLGDVTVKRPE